MSHLCPVCKSEVETLKSNSHILPRWLLVCIKENGKFVELKNREIKKAQSDPKADIVCQSCEEKFAQNDTFAANFFRDKKYFIKKDEILYKNEQLLFERHGIDSLEKLLYFQISLALRTHLWNSINLEDRILGKKFDLIAESYLKRTLSLADYPLIAVKYEILANSSSLSQKYRFENLISIGSTVFGYKTWVVTDSKKSLDPIWKMLMSYHDQNEKFFTIPIINGSNNKVSTDMLKIIQSHQKVNFR